MRMVKIINRTLMPTRGIVLSYFGWLRNARLVQVHSSTLLTSVRTKTTMACRRILLQLPRNATVWSRSASGQTTGVDYLKPEDNTQVKTHTGQVFTDYRNARFENSTRYVNKNHAIDLIAEVPPKECTERVVFCDGGGGPLGHPKVYINLDKPGAHPCGYCGLQFVKKDHHH